MRAALAEADDGARAERIETLLAEETRMGMLVGVAVGWELARELDAQRRPSRRLNVDIRFLGHACFELTEGDTRVLDRPVPDRQPQGRGRGLRASTRRTSS